MFVSRSVPNYLGNLASLSVSFASKPHGCLLYTSDAADDQ